jgi:hypothetical protein
MRTIHDTLFLKCSTINKTDLLNKQKEKQNRRLTL